MPSCKLTRRVSRSCSARVRAHVGLWHEKGRINGLPARDVDRVPDRHYLANIENSGHAQLDVPKHRLGSSEIRHEVLNSSI